MKNRIVWCLIMGWVTCASSVAQNGSPVGAATVSRGMDKEEYAEQAKTRWEKIKKELGTRKRTKDPFGAVLDPATLKEETAVSIADVVKTVKVVVPIKVVSLQEAVDKFQVNGVNAAKQMVMVGFRSLRRGDPVEITHDGELFKLRIEKITVNEVVFLNTKNNETASVRLGVVKGIRGIRGKGLKDKVLKKRGTLQIK